MDKEQKAKPSLKLWITIGIIAAVVILAVVLILVNRGERKNGDWATVIPGTTQQGDRGEPVTGEDGEPVTGEDGEPVVSANSGDNQGQNSQDATQGTGADNQATGETGAENTTPIQTIGDEDPYENCLVSAMIVGISMQYSDYEFLGIYTASETPIAAHNSSKGAYVIFNGDGEKRALKAVPLEAERTERGTADIYVAALGYATYELVDPNSVPINGLKEHKLEDLADLIGAYSLVSIIER